MSILAFVLVSWAPGEAAAESPGPDEAPCVGKQSGEACTLINGNSGSCGPGTCSRLDYSQGSPPRATEEPCTVCTVGAAPKDAPPALGTSAGSTGVEPRSEPSSDEPKPTEATETDEPPKTSSRCSVMDHSAPSDLGWLGLLALALVVRRRTRSPR